MTMRTHVQLIGWLNIALGALAAAGGFFAFALFGFLGFAASSGGDASALPIFGSIGGFLSLILLATAAPSIVVGVGLLNFAPWARILAIVLSVLHLINATTIGLSTLLGIYSLIILFSAEAARLFERRGY
jgi:hypothetical protein